MANLQQRRLSFKEVFAGFNLKVDFYCTPRNDDPRTIYDYGVDFISATTTYEHVDIHLLAAAMEKIDLLIQAAILRKAHSLYIADLKAEKAQYKSPLITF